jgi:hypothetical protein
LPSVALAAAGRMSAALRVKVDVNSDAGFMAALLPDP